MADKNNERYLVPALERGLKILQIFSNEKKPLSISEIARSLDITRSSAFRLTITLEHLGFLQQLENSKKYQLGTKILDLGFGYLAGLDVVEASRGPLQALCDELNVSTQLVIREQTEILYLLRYAANSHLTSNIHIGSRLPVYATSLGQVLLTDLPSNEIKKLFKDQTFKIYTKNTPNNINKLLKCVDKARPNGYIISIGLFEPTLTSIATGIHDHTGKIIAAINTTSPASQFTQKKLETSILNKVCQTAQTISRKLGYNGS